MSALPEGLQPRSETRRRAAALANARLLLDQVEAQPSADFALVAISADSFCEATGTGPWQRPLCAAVQLLQVTMTAAPAPVVQAVKAALAQLPVASAPPVYNH